MKAKQKICVCADMHLNTYQVFWKHLHQNGNGVCLREGNGIGVRSDEDFHFSFVYLCMSYLRQC